MKKPDRTIEETIGLLDQLIGALKDLHSIMDRAEARKSEIKLAA